MKFLPHWRKATWAIVLWTGLAILWVAAGANAASSLPSDCGTLDQATCEAAAAVGTGIGVGIIFFVWFLGFIILGIIWFMSRPRYIEYQGKIMKESEARKLSVEQK